MNLADIRKKAQQGEPTQATATTRAPVPAPEAAPVQSATVAPPAPEPQLQEPVETPAPVRVPVQPQPQTAAPCWFPDPPPVDTGAWPGFEEEPAGFDPAAVILKGRESSSFAEEVSGREDLEAASVELLCFKVADEEYAISIMNIKEIVKPREVTEVPRVPAFVRGILSLRGNIIPIFDMRVRLGLPGALSSERERIVVVKRLSGFCGVLVDEVVQVVRIAEAGIEPPPVVLEGIDRDFVKGIGRVGGRMLILLDMEKVLDVGLL